MKNITEYDNFTPLFESLKLAYPLPKLREARKKYGITDSEWIAMRSNPGNKETSAKYKEYYEGDGAKLLTDKILNLVCFYIFGDNNNMKDLMMGIAEVESCYGTNPSTYKKSDFTQGMFQLDKASSLKTIGYKGVMINGNENIKNRLNACRNKVKQKLGLDWNSVPYDSIAKPLYSAIAARMYIESKLQSYDYDKSTNKITPKDHPIGNSRKQHASWWKKRYNTVAGAGTENKFLNPPGCSI